MFRGTIHLPDDAEHLDATMLVQAGRVIIQVEGQAICEWEAGAVTLEHRSDGILLSLNGESLVVSPVDRYGFSDAVEAARTEAPTKRRRRRRRNQPAPSIANGDAGGEVKQPRRERKRRVRRTRAEAAVEQPSPDPATVPKPARPAAPSPAQDPWVQPGLVAPAAATSDPPPSAPPTPATPPPSAEPRSEPSAPPATAPRSLSEVVRDATDHLPGRRSRRDEPVDINREIFGDDYDRPEPKKPGLGTRVRTWWSGLLPRWRIALIGIVVGVPATIFASEVVATILVLGGLGACLLGGAGMADPHYTRKLPSHITEIRLLIAGVLMIIAGFLVGLPSL